MTPGAAGAAADIGGAVVAEVREGLSATPRRLPTRLLYDALGSALFDAICELPWYPITRAETRLLAAHAGEILGGPLAPGRVVELGAGNGSKLALLLERGLRGKTSGPAPEVHLVDVSPAALAVAGRAVAAAAPGRVQLHEATFEAGIAAIGAASSVGRTLVAFLGSNLGNLDARAARRFLRNVRAALTPGDLLLLGVDLVKPEREMVLAYADPLGVTAAFNLNLLLRVNRELDADFDVTAFQHRALWNAAESRMEMHLISRADQRVRVGAAGLDLAFRRGEAIWTESSYKYTLEDLGRLLDDCGFDTKARWVDDTDPFALTLAER